MSTQRLRTLSRTGLAVVVLAAGLVNARASTGDKPVSNGIVSKSIASRIEPLVGDYHGQWTSELTENVYDDISRYDLEDPVMRLSLDGERRVNVTFYMDADAANAGEALDLLGFGCHSAVGPLLRLNVPDPVSADASTRQRVFYGSFDFDWGNCPARIHASPNNDLEVEISVDPAEHQYIAHLKLLRSVQPVAKVYADTREGRREVKIRRKTDDPRSVYNPQLEYCVMNDVGEVEACFPRKSELKTYLVPFPLPGLTAFWYTKKSPRLTADQGKTLEYHEADFRRVITPR